MLNVTDLLELDLNEPSYPDTTLYKLDLFNKTSKGVCSKSSTRVWLGLRPASFIYISTKSTKKQIDKEIFFRERRNWRSTNYKPEVILSAEGRENRCQIPREAESEELRKGERSVL